MANVKIDMGPTFVPMNDAKAFLDTLKLKELKKLSGDETKDIDNHTYQRLDYRSGIAFECVRCNCSYNDPSKDCKAEPTDANKKETND